MRSYMSPRTKAISQRNVLSQDYLMDEHVPMSHASPLSILHPDASYLRDRSHQELSPLTYEIYGNGYDSTSKLHQQQQQYQQHQLQLQARNSTHLNQVSPSTISLAMFEYLFALFFYIL